MNGAAIGFFAEISGLCIFLAFSNVFFAATTFFALVDPAGVAKARRWLAKARE